MDSSVTNRGGRRLRWFAGLLTAGWAFTAAAVEAPRTVAILRSSDADPFEVASRATEDAVRATQSEVRVESHTINRDDPSGLARLARLAAIPNVLLVTMGSSATAAVLDSGYTGPHVFSMVLYPQQSGLIRAERPNLAGVTLDIPLDRQFQLLRRLRPDGRRVGVLYHPDETGQVVEAARIVALANGFELVATRVDDAAGAVRGLDSMVGSIDLLWSVADSHVFTAKSTERLILTALRHRIPLIGISAAQVRAGAVAALYCDYADIGRQTADLAAGILSQEASAARVVGPRSVSVAINLRSAERCGVELPSDLAEDAAMVFR